MTTKTNRTQSPATIARQADGIEYLIQWGIQDPDEVGASEYRAIHECLADALDGCELDVSDDPKDFAVAILGEFIGHAQAMLAKLTPDHEFCECGRRPADCATFDGATEHNDRA